tara:strand:- start:340 stop:1728 length:1389 start_codon:yes stop_codon:yes gene_type:complete
MSEQLGIGQIIKNFLGIGDDDKEPSGAVSSSLRPKARPEGLMSSPRPIARPEDTDDDDTPSTNEDVVTNTITMMNDYDDSEEEVGVPLDSANIQELLINPNSLYDRHSTTIRRLSKFGNEVPTVMKQKLRSPVVNDLLVDVTAMLAKEQSANRPPEEPEFIDVPKPIPVTLNNREIQEKLVDAGYNITVDGVVGPQTKKAIKAFQKEKGLKVDGVVGKNTTAALAGVPEITSESIGKAPEVEQKTQMELLMEGQGLMSKPVEGKLGGDEEGINDGATVVKSGLFEGLGNFLENFGTTEFRFFANNILNAGGSFTEENITDSDINALRNAVSNAMEDGRKYTKYEDLGQKELDVNKKGPLAGILNPELRMARSFGVFRFDTNKNGDVVINDTFDYNDGPRRKEYYKALEDDNKKLARQLLLDASPVQAASMVGYAKQEDLKKEGKPFQTFITVNLGNPETWGD